MLKNPDLFVVFTIIFLLVVYDLFRFVRVSVLWLGGKSQYFALSSTVCHHCSGPWWAISELFGEAVIFFTLLLGG